MFPQDSGDNWCWLVIDVANVNISTSKYVVSSCCGDNNESHVDLASSGKLEWLQQ